jgi:recombination associated protein RdgC
MIPKNIIPYIANREFIFTPNETRISEFAFVPCGSQDKQKFGWTKPLGNKSELYSHISQSWVLLTACKQEKILPASSIAKLVSEKVKAIEEQEGRPLKKKEKDQLRDDVLMDALPRAFVKDTFTNLWIHPEKGYYLVDTSSRNTAESVLALLRKTCGSLPVIPLMPEIAVESKLTDMVKSNTTPAGYTIGTKAELASILDDGAIVRLKDEDMTSEAVLKHIDESKLVTMLRLVWQDRIAFNLTSDFSLKAMKFNDELKEQNDDIPREDVAARFDADFLLISAELEALIPSVKSVFNE